MVFWSYCYQQRRLDRKHTTTKQFKILDSLVICYIGTTDQLVSRLIDTDIGIILSRRQEFGGLAAIAIVRRTYIATQPRRLVRPVRAKKGEIMGDHHYFRLCAFSYKPVYIWIVRPPIVESDALCACGGYGEQAQKECHDLHRASFPRSKSLNS